MFGKDIGRREHKRAGLWLRPEKVRHFGGGGSSVPSTTTSSTTSNPWSGQQPYLSLLFGDASNNLAQGGPQYYPGSTYVPITAQQYSPLNEIITYGQNGGNQALQNAAQAGANLESGNYTAATGAAFGAANPEIASLSNGSLLGQTNPTFNNSQSLLNSELSGAYLNPANDPGFGAVVNNTLASVMPGINASFVNGGRMDSGLASAAAAQGATNAVGNLELNNYLAERQNQNTAAQQAASNQGMMLGGTETAGQLASQNLNTQLQQQMQGMFAIPGIDQAQLGDIGQAYNAASEYQTNAQNQLNADIDAWNYNQMQPWNTLGMYQGLISGGYGGSSTGSMTTPYYTNPTSNALSGAMGGAMLGGSLLGASGLGLMGTGAGSGIGAGLGLLMGLFSDRRLKTDIHEVGETKDGLPLYSFRYKFDPKGTLRIGLMAQDVEKENPDAVIHTPFGMMVNYADALDLPVAA